MATTDEPGVCSGDPPAIAPHGDRGEPWIVGTPVYVWQVVAALERDGSPAAVARDLGIGEHQARVAAEFYERAPDAIDRRLAARRLE